MGKYLIYGGNGGIGSAIARRLSRAGHDLILAGRNAAELETISRELGAETSVCDVLDGAQIEATAEAAGATLDGLVYAVGSINLKPFSKVTGDDLITDFHLNAVAAAMAVQASTRALMNAGSGASVLLFSTVAVDQGFASHASIAMAKGAVVGLVRTLATEFAPKIRVNAIAPSLVDSKIGKTISGNARMAEAVARMHAVPRLGQPDDIAAMGELLLTENGSWITGQVIGVDGGRSTIRVMRS